jgi:hypothetical protein
MGILRVLPVISISLVAIAFGSHIQAAVAASSDVVARERAGCIQMGLNPTEDAFDYCMVSLARSAAATERADIIETYREACAQQGLGIGTTPFDVCVVRMRNAALGAHPF